jgi:hypothetical protein
MGRAGLAGIVPDETASLLVAAAALGLTAVVALMWLLPSDSPGIRFSDAEIALLFPAPLSRRSLIHFKVLDAQLSSLLQSLFFALIFSRRSLGNHEVIATILSWWTLLTFINLHYMGASLTIARLAAGGLDSGRRRTVVLVLLAAVAGVVGLGLWHALPSAASVGTPVGWFSDVVNSPVLRVLLWPAKRVVAPFFASGLGGFLAAFAAAAAILALHYLWVVRIEVAFEEASIAQAERRAARVTELRHTGTIQLGGKPRGRKPPFDVARARWPELAFLWKNLLSVGRPWFTVRAWLIAAGVLVATSVVLQRRMGSEYWMAGGFLAGFGLLGAGLTLLYGPLITRFDLRRDLGNVDILRTYPLPGWRIVLGELLAPMVILTGIIWLALLAWFLGLHGHQPPSLPIAWFNPGMRVVLVGCAAALTPFVVLLQLIVPNGAAILFPGVFRTSQVPGGGLDLMGQRMLFGFGQIFALLAAFLPAFALAFASFFIVRGLYSLLSWLEWWDPAEPSYVLSAIVMTLVAAATITAEIACGIWWFGGRFERSDLVTESRT